MKKILAFLSSFIFIGSSVLVVSACGVSKGQEIPTEIKFAPTKAENNQDPLVDYVYNDQYVYSENTATYPLGVAAQLVSDKLYRDPNSFTGAVWKEFYNSQAWQRGYFSSINYDITDTGLTQAFAFEGADNKQFIINVNNNDLSEDKNIIRFYWFLTSANPWSSSNPSGYQPSKNTIVVPDQSEFNDEVKTITKQGYIHIYLEIGTFRLDFSALLNFDFFKIVDRNDQPAVLLSANSFRKPFGDISFDNPEKTFAAAIKNLEISKVA